MKNDTKKESKEPKVDKLIEEKSLPEVTLSHPKAKEWIVSMAKANYQELAKLANEFPELVKLQDPSTGYTALHWAAKHGNEDVVKLIAGTYKADVNARTNGGYTPLHLAMQFGRVNIFELLCNVYKANRDLMDWSGNKPLDYSKQYTSVSASTYSSEYIELLNNFNNIERRGTHTPRTISGGGGGRGGTLGSALTRGKKRSQLLTSGTVGSALGRTQSMLTSVTMPRRPSKPEAQSFMYANDDLVPCDIFNPGPASKSSSNNNSLKDIFTELPQSSSDASSEEKMSSYKGAVSTKDNFGTLASTRRKKSFLRKTLRAAVTPTKHDVVTNPKITE